jgi:hypothetical protein
MTAVTAERTPGRDRDPAVLSIEAFPAAVVRRLRFAGYGTLPSPERAAARLRAARCEILPRQDNPAAPLEFAPITPEIAAQNRATLEAALPSLTRAHCGGSDV